MKNFVSAVFLSFLVACSTPEREIIVRNQVATLEVPASLQVRCRFPVPPGAGSKQSAVARYMLELNEALEICAARHATLVSVINDFSRRVDEDAANR